MTSEAFEGALCSEFWLNLDKSDSSHEEIDQPEEVRHLSDEVSAPWWSRGCKRELVKPIIFQPNSERWEGEKRGRFSS